MLRALIETKLNQILLGYQSFEKKIKILHLMAGFIKNSFTRFILKTNPKFTFYSGQV